MVNRRIRGRGRERIKEREGVGRRKIRGKRRGRIKGRKRDE